VEELLRRMALIRNERNRGDPVKHIALLLDKAGQFRATP
jgi:hypothetical protein